MSLSIEKDYEIIEINGINTLTQLDEISDEINDLNNLSDFFSNFNFSSINNNDCYFNKETNYITNNLFEINLYYFQI